MRFRKKLALVLLALLVIFFVLYFIFGEGFLSSPFGLAWMIVGGIIIAVGFISELISLLNRYKK